MKNLIINNLGMNGEGVGKLDGKVCFVKYALPKENIDIEIIEEKKDFCIGRLENINNSSSDRVNPKCPYYKICGGCDLQHLKYDKQLDFKKNLIEETLKKIANIEIKVNNIFYDKQYNYRNKSVFAVEQVNGNIFVGMKQENSNTVVDIENCDLQDKLSNKILILFKTFLKEEHIACSGLDKQGVSHIVIRVINNKALITIVSNLYIEKLILFENKLKSNNIEYGLYININTNKNKILSNKTMYLGGIKQLSDEINGIKYFISPNSFLQVNTQIQNQLYTTVVSEIDGETVIDCYSGAGLMSALISKKAKKVYGIEIVRQATEDANLLIQHNNITNLSNINGDTKKELPKLLSTKKTGLNVVLDPPRNGCDKKVLKILLDNCVDKIIYISCLPRTLARDISILKEKYKINEVYAFEMFPNTKHIETLVILTKK